MVAPTPILKLLFMRLFCADGRLYRCVVVFWKKTHYKQIAASWTAVLAVWRLIPTVSLVNISFCRFVCFVCFGCEMYFQRLSKELHFACVETDSRGN